MLLRYFAILLLILLALRLIGRVLEAVRGEGGRRRTAPAPPKGAGSPAQRQLAPCAHCGTYFDPDRALSGPGGRKRLFCSEACVEAHRLADPTRPDSADAPQDPLDRAS